MSERVDDAGMVIPLPEGRRATSRGRPADHLPFGSSMIVGMATAVAAGCAWSGTFLPAPVLFLLVPSFAWIAVALGGLLLLGWFGIGVGALSALGGLVERDPRRYVRQAVIGGIAAVFPAALLAFGVPLLVSPSGWVGLDHAAAAVFVVTVTGFGALARLLIAFDASRDQPAPWSRPATDRVARSRGDVVRDLMRATWFGYVIGASLLACAAITVAVWGDLPLAPGTFVSEAALTSTEFDLPVASTVSQGLWALTAAPVTLLVACAAAAAAAAARRMLPAGMPEWLRSPLTGILTSAVVVGLLLLTPTWWRFLVVGQQPLAAGVVVGVSFLTALLTAPIVRRPRRPRRSRPSILASGPVVFPREPNERDQI